MQAASRHEIGVLSGQSIQPNKPEVGEEYSSIQKTKALEYII